MINIKGLDKAAVLAALYNAAKPLGMGILHYDPTPMTREQAQRILDGEEGFFERYSQKGPVARFDYLQGRVLKVNLSGDEFNPNLYDRDNGDGAAARAVDPLRTQ